jgi:hypothetical protein
MYVDQAFNQMFTRSTQMSGGFLKLAARRRIRERG